MIDRRSFSAMMAGSLAVAGRSFAQAPLVSSAKTVFYASVGPRLTRYDVDVDAATLQSRGAVDLPADVQYAWPHPSKRFLYVVSSNGQPGGGDAPAGDTHVATAFRIDPGTGALAKHGPDVRLPSRPIHTSVDGAGRFLLIAFNQPSDVVVHRLRDDGTIGERVIQPGRLNTGIYGHQNRTTPSNKTAILVTRGNNAAGPKSEDPGALKVFGFEDGILTNLQSVAPGTGLGFGPRHLDFHPRRPFVFVSIERQNQIYVYRLKDDSTLVPDPLFVKTTLAGERDPNRAQGAGTIHLHPNGRFAYIPNRASGTARIDGKDVFAGGENNIAVFALNEDTGEPTKIQNIDGHGIQLRTFGIDPTGKLLVAASIQPMLIRDGDKLTTLSAGLSVYRIGEDGRLAFVRKYDVNTGNATQFWSGMVALG